MRLINADALRKRMYHDAFVIDSDMQKWDSGCWIRYKMFENAIEDAPIIEERKWIPCSEQLPRQGQEVICQCRANMIKVLKIDAYGDWYQDAEHCYMSGFVIAWMPLPEPYEERREE